MPSSVKSIVVGARASKLSQVQVQEIQSFFPDLEFELLLVKTTGDNDLQTSLRTLDKTDFFTKEIDQMLLEGKCRIAIHSAKDLPDPLPLGLKVVALTKGVDPRDMLVYNCDPLPLGAKIGTSSIRREHNLLEWRPDLNCVDIRGTIEQRLAQLDAGIVDGLVMAEAALIRLGLTYRRRMPIHGEVAPLQGRLAVVARVDDIEMDELFAKIEYREKGSKM